jgi:hypothetical protein
MDVVAVMKEGVAVDVSATAATTAAAAAVAAASAVGEAG